MVSTANDDLHRHQAFTLDSYNLHHSQHTAFINLLIGPNHARRFVESTADRWYQRFKKVHRKLDLNSAAEFNIKVHHKPKPKRVSTFLEREPQGRPTSDSKMTGSCGKQLRERLYFPMRLRFSWNEELGLFCYK